MTADGKLVASLPSLKEGFLQPTDGLEEFQEQRRSHRSDLALGAAAHQKRRWMMADFLRGLDYLAPIWFCVFLLPSLTVWEEGGTDTLGGLVGAVVIPLALILALGVVYAFAGRWYGPDGKA